MVVEEGRKEERRKTKLRVSLSAHQSRFAAQGGGKSPAKSGNLFASSQTIDCDDETGYAGQH